MDSTSGLFYVSKLNAHGTEATDGFCKPINIRVYSAPPPVRMRVVTYEMAYWESDAQPELDVHWDEAKKYRSPHTGDRSFSFTVGTIPMDLSAILTEIRRHFHAIVLQGKRCRNKDEGVERMSVMNTADKYFTNSEGEYFRVFNVTHLIAIKLNINKAHYLAGERLLYSGEYRSGESEPIYTEDRIDVPLTYRDNRDLCKQALNHFAIEGVVKSALKVSP